MYPSTWERITEECRRIMSHHGALVAHIAGAMLALLVAAVLLEVFVFNMNYWETRGNNPIDLASKIDLPKNDKGHFLLTESNSTIDLAGLNKEIHNVRIDFSDAQSAKNLQVKIQFTDAAHQTYFDSTEYTQGVPIRKIATNCDATEYVKLSTNGLTNNLRIEIVGENVRYPIIVNTVLLNDVYPFKFSTTRFAATWCIVTLIYLFRPRSRVYSITIVDFPRLSKASVVLFTTVEIILVSAFLFMGSNQVGVATQSYNWGSWDGVSLVNTFEVGGDNAQQYAYLAQALADGQLHLEVDPPDWLLNMDNPYDKGARDQLQKETGEPYLWDVAFYQGNYYVYFGVVPALVFYLPFYLIARASFPTAIGVWLCALAFILGCTALLDRFARYHFKRVSLGLYLLLQIPLIFCSGILYLVKHPTFYSLPIMMALALSVWGLYLWMRGRRSNRPYGCYLVGSLCMALVLGCRPQLVVLSFVAFPLFWRHYISHRHIVTKRGALEFACLIAPYVLVVAGIMWYNAARFGSPFDFGSSYNLTTNDMTKRGWDAGRLLPALFAFFVQTPSTSGTFPYLQPCAFDTTYMGQTIKEVTFGGVFACLPVLWLLALAPEAIRMRIAQRSTHTIAGVMGVLIASAIVVALADAELAGILQRYYADFSVMLLLVVVLVAFIFNERIDQQGQAYGVAVKLLPMLVVLSLAYMLCLCFVAESDWYSDVYPWAYQCLVHAFQFWT